MLSNRGHQRIVPPGNKKQQPAYTLAAVFIICVIKSLQAFSPASPFRVLFPVNIQCCLSTTYLSGPFRFQKHVLTLPATFLPLAQAEKAPAVSGSSAGDIG